MTNGHSVAEYASPVPAEPNLSGASDSLTIEAAPRILSESQVADRDSDSLEAVRAEHESDLAATHPPAGLARISPLWWVTGITLVACLAVIVAVIQRGLGNGSMTRQPDPSSSVAAAGGDARDSAADIGLDLYADWPRDRLPQVADIWSRVGPYIVSVERTTADGPQIAAGVLIDTRGWVLSVGNEQDSDYRLHTAPADPTRSEATTADSAVSVRVDGVLAHREAWGLVVLQVDPEPFRVFDDLEFSNAAPAGADRIAIGPGADGRWLAPISAVQPKERTDGLAIPDRFDRRRLAGLLLDSRGEVIGIGVPSTDGNRALMIGGAELTSWISQLRDSGTPPKMPAAMDAAPDSTPDDSDSDEGAAVNRESPSGGAADTVPAATPSRPAADLASELDPLAVGSIEDGLLPLNQPAVYLGHLMTYIEYEFDEDEAYGEHFTKSLGRHQIVVSRNHGYYALGDTPAAAFFRAYFLKQTCAAQIATLSMGRAPHLLDPQKVARYRDQMYTSEHYHYDGKTEWPGLIRLLDRTQPDYKE